MSGRRVSWDRTLVLGSVLFCALAFNLTFFFQELFLVIPKALLPGVHATLYHNNHDWTGSDPRVELLQGTARARLPIWSSGLCSRRCWRVRAVDPPPQNCSCSGWRSRVFINVSARW